MSRLRSPLVIGLLCAIPVALFAGWFATLVFDPTGGGAPSTTPYGSIPRALGMGPLRGLAFGLGALIAGGFVGPRLAREDVGSFGGLAMFVGLAHLLAGAGVALDVAVRDPGSLEPSILFAWPLALVLIFGGSLIMWLPAGAVWVSAVRRLTIEDQFAPTDVERALSEQMRNETAREHVITDATNLADQGSRLYRNRG